MVKLEAETLSGITVSFSYAAYTDALNRYSLSDIEAVVERVESRKPWQRVKPEVANFFRDLAAIQEMAHPEYDRGVAIGGLATRIEVATGQVPDEKMAETLSSIERSRVEYDLGFGHTA